MKNQEAAAGDLGVLVEGAPMAGGDGGEPRMEVVLPSVEEEEAPAVVKGKAAVDAADLEEAAIGKGVDVVDDALPFHERFVDPYDSDYYDDEEIEDYNSKSYEQKQRAKFGAGELRVLKRGKHDCPFCPGKLKKGDLHSLEKHALALRSMAIDEKGKADHLALAHYLLGDNLPPYGQPSKKRKRKRRKFY